MFVVINLPGGSSSSSSFISVRSPINPRQDLSTIGGIITALLPYIFLIAGLILLFVIIGAGFTMFTSAGNPEKTKQAGARLTTGLIGFIIIFAAYWIVQLLELIFGFQILGS